jgi:hypothetical protein
MAFGRPLSPEGFERRVVDHVLGEIGVVLVLFEGPFPDELTDAAERFGEAGQIDRVVILGR